MSHRVDPGFGGERALGDKCALPSSLYTGVRYKPLLTGGWLYLLEAPCRLPLPLWAGHGLR